MRFVRITTLICACLVFAGCARLLGKDSQTSPTPIDGLTSPMPTKDDTYRTETELRGREGEIPVKMYDRDYIIGPEDVLKIQVWDNTDLDRIVQISREGTFSFPLIGSVRADGLSVAQLEKELRNRLADGYIVNPQVTITIEEFKSKKVFVLGEVYKPGTYPLTGSTDLLEIIAQAGGRREEAGREIIVIRPQNYEKQANPVMPQEARESEILKIDIQKLLSGDIHSNIELRTGDTIYVPERSYFYVIGEVNKPGRYELEKETTVLKGITIAGGFTEKASKWRTKILRKKDDKKLEIKVKMDHLVEPEDIISVPESFF